MEEGEEVQKRTTREVEVLRLMLDEGEVVLKRRSWVLVAGSLVETSSGTLPQLPSSLDSPSPPPTPSPPIPSVVRSLERALDRLAPLAWTGAEEGTARPDSSSFPLPPKQPTPPASSPFEDPQARPRMSSRLDKKREEGPFRLASTAEVAQGPAMGGSAWSTTGMRHGE